MTELDLSYNQINCQDASLLADALTNNQVICNNCNNLTYTFILQTLITLNLYNNKIGINGAKSIAEALLNNTVNCIFSFYFVVYSFIDFNEY